MIVPTPQDAALISLAWLHWHWKKWMELGP